MKTLAPKFCLSQTCRRVRNVARKKKKKEKSRQKVLKERKFGTTQLILNEDYESIDGENPSLEIVEEDNSPTASSTSANSSGLENQLLEPLEMEVNVVIQSISWGDHHVYGEDKHLQKLEDICFVHETSKKDTLGSITSFFYIIGLHLFLTSYVNFSIIFNSLLLKSITLPIHSSTLSSFLSI